MEKWLMILELDGTTRYLMVRKDKHQDVHTIINNFVDEYEKEMPPQPLNEYVIEGLETLFDKDIVEPIKLGSKLIREAIIWKNLKW